MSVTTNKEIDIPDRYIKDVQEYLEENNDGRTDLDLSPEEFFKIFLEWNGIIGYDYMVWELAKALLQTK